MKKYYFFKNIGCILIYALFGTFIALLIQASLMRLSSYMGIFFNIGFHHCLIFSTIISATDPVSVLTTFQGF